MASGFDRYYQLAKCFRDEDLRADRQPEFTQIDMEMSFIRPADIQRIVEMLVRRLWLQFKSTALPDPFPRMTFGEAMARYGSDKPDLRFGLEIISSPALGNDDNGETASGRIVEALLAPHAMQIGSSELRKLADIIGQDGIKMFKLNSTAAIESLQRNLTPQLFRQLKCAEGDVAFIGQRDQQLSGGQTAMGRLRLQLAQRLMDKG
jgi:aspartyl-tRNA synthetase